jgi:colanic acid biosynthesis glycosyl transferase WcaI
VVSARHFSDLAAGLVKRGWGVQVLTSNRYCRHPKETILPREEEWRGVRIIRSARPAWNQAHPLGRLGNFLWLSASWAKELRRIPETDALILGTDPQFAQLLFPLIHRLRRKTRLVHWCFDLYPEAILADGANGFSKWMASQSIPLMKQAYSSVDLIVDIGTCMRRRFDTYHPQARRTTLTPWALIEPERVEPPDPETRKRLFGDAQLALLYAGNLGKAHEFSLFLHLARRVYQENPRIVFCFAGRGNRWEELQRAVRLEDKNIRIASFAGEEELAQRLAAADIHLLSLRSGWEGIVVPSKFFGSLAVGRPVLYAGPEESAIASWIREFRVGIILNEKNLERASEEILAVADQPDRLQGWGQNAYTTYHRHFSKDQVMARWDQLLRELIRGRTRGNGSLQGSA